jgi:hypothetical protein
MTNGYEGADPGALRVLANMAGTVGTEIGWSRSAVAAALDGVGASSSVLGTLVAIEAWLDQERIDLLRRAEEIEDPLGLLEPGASALRFEDHYLHPVLANPVVANAIGIYTDLATLTDMPSTVERLHAEAALRQLRDATGPVDPAALTRAENAVRAAGEAEGPLAAVSRVMAPVALAADVDTLVHPEPGALGHVDQVVAAAGVFSDGAATLVALGLMEAMPLSAVVVGIGVAAYWTGRALWENRQWISEHVVAPAMELQGQVLGEPVRRAGESLQEAGRTVTDAGHDVEDSLHHAGDAVRLEAGVLAGSAGPVGPAVGAAGEMAADGLDELGADVSAVTDAVGGAVDSAGQALASVGTGIEDHFHGMAEAADRLFHQD